MRGYLMIGVYLVFLTTGLAKAESQPLGQFIETEIEQMQNGLESTPTEQACPLSETGTDAWYFRRFFLRIRPNVTFTVGVASIAVVPDIELVWDKQLPAGWTDYTP